MKNFILMFCACALFACEKPAEKPPVPRPALVMTIKSDGAAASMSIVGEIKPRYESSQGFRVAGKVIERKVEVGALVKKGQLLAKLDSADANLTIQANNADIASAQAQLNLAQTNLARQRQLIDKKFVSPAALDSFEAAYESAKARLAQSQAQTAVSNNQSRYTALMADRNGIVTMIRAEPGQVVAAGEVVAQIIDPTQMEVHIPVPESRMSHLKVGEEASMRLWAKTEKSYQVKVREISPAADAVTRTFLVKLSILNADNEVRLGMTAGVRLTKEIQRSLLVPSTAVLAQNQQAVVWVVNAQNQANPVHVKVSSYREDGALISDGLHVGDKIVVAGAQALNVGQVVRPVEQPFSEQPGK